MIIRFILFLLIYNVGCTNAAEKNVYINPDSQDGSERKGTVENPYLSLDEVKLESNTNYYIRRSTRLILSRPLQIHGIQNVSFSAYGKGNNPVVLVQSLPKPLDIYHSQQIKIENLKIQGTGTNIFGVRISGQSNDITIESCNIENALWGLRLMGRSNQEPLKNIKVKNTTIQNIGDDGIFAMHVSGLMVDSCNINKVNQKWFYAGKTESQAPGDAIQLEKCYDFTIQNSQLDRTDTGNKFAFIANNSVKGLIQHNTIKGPSSEGEGGAAIYLGYTSDSIDLVSNIIKNSPCAVYTHANNITLHRNVLSNNEVGIWLKNTEKALLLNNTFMQNPLAVVGSNVEMFNNIFYSTTTDRMFKLKEPYKSDYNCFYAEAEYKFFEGYRDFKSYVNSTGNDNNSIYSDPLFTGNTEERPEYYLEHNSPCIDKGKNITVKYNPENEYCGNGLDMGAREYCKK
ncbi:MAG: right-handed parallel beta-helix repeat-containing protein [Bacteroidales bacterium]